VRQIEKIALRALLPVCTISVNTLTFGDSYSTALSLGESTRAASPTCSLPASSLPLKSSTMSLYSQNGYGQVSYGGPSYTQTSGYYQPPPPAPFYHVDPNAFRRDYASRLAELTINSRPIIQNLSMIAQEYTRFSEIVAQCLEAHIRRVSSIHYFTVSTLRCWMSCHPWTRSWYSSCIICCSHVMYLVLVLYFEQRQNLR
jgi:hypothetical protein